MNQSPTDAEMVLVVAGLTLFGLACLQDWALRLVPNRVPAAIALAGLAARFLDGTLFGGIIASATIFLAAAALWRRGWLGGADVKLFAAGALLVPPASAIGFVLASCVAGGGLALAYLALSCVVPAPAAKRPIGRLRRYLRLEQRRLRRRGPLPYATAIAAGAAFIVLRG